MKQPDFCKRHGSADRLQWLSYVPLGLTILTFLYKNDFSAVDNNAAALYFSIITLIVSQTLVTTIESNGWKREVRDALDSLKKSPDHVDVTYIGTPDDGLEQCAAAARRAKMVKDTIIRSTTEREDFYSDSENCQQVRDAIKQRIIGGGNFLFEQIISDNNKNQQYFLSKDIPPDKLRARAIRYAIDTELPLMNFTITDFGGGKKNVLFGYRIGHQHNEQASVFSSDNERLIMMFERWWEELVKAKGCRRVKEDELERSE